MARKINLERKLKDGWIPAYDNKGNISMLMKFEYQPEKPKKGCKYLKKQDMYIADTPLTWKKLKYEK